MRTAPWWSFSAGHLISRGARLLVLGLAATLVCACVPEHGEEDYAMSAVTKPRRTERALATKVIALPDRALLTAAHPQACGSYASAPLTTGTAPRGEERAAHQPSSSGSKDAQDAPADADRRTTASAATPPANPASARDQAPSELEARIALEYERACYKLAEMRVRARLNRLQLSVRETIKGVERQSEKQH